MSVSNNTCYERFAATSTDYRIISSHGQLATRIDDPRYWRVVLSGRGAIEMLRVPVQVTNSELSNIENEFSLRVANQQELSAAFSSSAGHQYTYPWGDRPDAKGAPYLLRSNPKGMGMNMAGLYFNGPQNIHDAGKNGLWMVTAERDQDGNYKHGRRCGTAWNVGVFEEVVPGQKEVSPGRRGVLPGDRGILAGSRGVLPGERGRLDEHETADFLTPAGIGHKDELRANEGYLMVRPVTDERAAIYEAAIDTLGQKISADDGISLLSCGDAAKALGVTDARAPIVIFGVAGHCLMCPNPASLTIPINAPRISMAVNMPVLAYPEFADHCVVDEGRVISPIYPMQSAQAHGG